ncbi:MAG TPA: extracellular solute-binding protein, partial [Limnochordia bacterium]|nr:extracellular solute-binding protein [Limnochordia bacterium]
FDRDLKPQFSDPRTIDALRSIQDLIKSQVMPTPSLSKQGHSGMWFDWIGQISTLHQPDSWVSRFDTVALPRTANSAAVVSGQGFAISKGSKHVEAALKVIEWFTSPEMQKRMVEAGVWFPARISVAKFGQPADHRPAHYQQTFIEPIVEYGFSPYWYVPGWSEASAKITPLLNGVWELKDAPAHAALAIDEALKGVKMTPMG